MEGAWQPIIDQGPLFAFMAIVIWAGGKFIKNQLERAELKEKGREEAALKREEDREARYNQLVDKIIIVQGEQTVAVTAALTASTSVMERVEKKLDASDH